MQKVWDYLFNEEITHGLFIYHLNECPDIPRKPRELRSIAQYSAI